MRIGVVSDVHCNATALAWAIRRLERDVEEIFVAGDAIYEYRFSDPVIDLIRDSHCHYVLGNHEIQFLRSQDDRPPSGINQAHLRFVAGAPRTLTMKLGGKRIMMVHGVPWAPYSDYVYPNSPQLARFAEVDADIIIVGHTHTAMAERVGSVLVVNPGSVGEARGPAPHRLTYATIDLATDEVDLFAIRPEDLAKAEDPGAA
jgi:putative phosphoesterase